MLSLFCDAFRKSLITVRAFFSDNCLPKKTAWIFFLHDSVIGASADAPHITTSREKTFIREKMGVGKDDM